MSWQDREYARPYSPFGSTPFRRRRSWLIRESVVTTLIAVNVAIFVVGALGVRFPVLSYLTYGLGAMQGEAVLNGQVWRLLTAQYLHAGFGHLFFNMLTLHFLGRPLERLWSPRKFLVVYTIAGLVGNLFFTYLAARNVIDPRVPAVGASGSINGIIGIAAVMFPQATVYIYFLLPLSLRTCAILFGAYSVLSIITRSPNYGGEACHLAGLVFGAWYAWKGEHWWQTTEWRIPGLRRKPTTHTSTRSESAWSRPQTPVDETELDRILKKVFDGGVHTLSEAEKTILKNATEQQKRSASSRGFS